VALIAASGVFGAVLLVREPMQLLVSWYGNGMLAKLALVFGALALAAWHKLRLTPALEAGAPGAGAALARSIRIEMIVIALIFYAAAEMVSVHPTDLGHRITS
jgi:putative copper export protein